ncbi:penicillin-binding protein 1A [Faunimonas pinastri]|uniref:Penicillin-binding protein 1A n=1 Tax=Faunimonas pinastri TaxID=1855383 RepID=A0A1H9CXW6_9HYPH|nr:penicillin-binding protein 1A [Faunimonas pinastri]SEQ06025.1 penicillin-binding protein 1A [Faunimonas pinastri]
MLMRIFGYIFGVGVFLALCVAGGVALIVHKYEQDLPDYEVLAKYEPPVMSRMEAADGDLIGEYASERRLYLPIQAIPNLVKASFLSAEDKNFYQHGGVDLSGIGRAIMVNLENRGSGRRLVGASTITQQVAKNMLLTNQVSFDRKIKEALLAVRMEKAYSKDKILELYLNEIYLGQGSYGVAAAALNYFDKSVNDLTIAQAAYLGALPKGPENYNPFRNHDRAVERRNWVIDRLVENGYIKAEEGEKAKAEPLTITNRPVGRDQYEAEYFTEEARRNLVDMVGSDKLYKGGLSVRTTLDPNLQRVARRALQDGLVSYDEKRGYRGPVKSIETDGDWGKTLSDMPGLTDVPEWKLAVVLSVSDTAATIGLQPDHEPSGALSKERAQGTIPLSEMKWAKSNVRKASAVLKVGDVVYAQKVKDETNVYRLRQPPEIQGALVAMDPYTGRVLALSGGFSFGQSEFNRATQAMRQPGSSFKPIVYSAALDNGYTPSSVVLDAPIELKAGNGKIWRPENDEKDFLGPSTLRTGIERSRNVMTIRLAQDMGMPLVVEYAKRFGVYDSLMPVLPMAIGAGETTVMRMVTAYATIANGGRKIEPTLIDRIQDRYGKTIYQHDKRKCEGCEAEEWNNQPEPTLVDNREQVLDPMTAYQITSMMEGVVQRGTATVVKQVGKPIAGKTGTTNDNKDAWFIGFSPDLVVGVFMGYDTPKPMGKHEFGGTLAAPVFTEFMKTALADEPAKPFQVPAGMTLIPIDRKTGLRTSGMGPNVILEAFKPGTEPPTSTSIIGNSQQQVQSESVTPEADRAVAAGTGGLY